MKLQNKGLTKEQRENLARNSVVMQVAKSRPCMDCKLTWHPLVMSFDHRLRENKIADPSSMRTASAEEFDRELAKCDVVCKNCHEMREFIRDIGRHVRDSRRRQFDYYKRLLPELTFGAILYPGAFERVRV